MHILRHLLVYNSPVDKPDDLIAAERAFVQDFFCVKERGNSMNLDKQQTETGLSCECGGKRSG